MTSDTKAWTDVELPRDPPAGASDFGLAMHYGNALLFELMRRHSEPAKVLQGILWYACIFIAQQPATTDQIVDEFRTTLERLRAGSGN